ncbi:MAG: Kelch repeat-containing protein, partial [Deltaproteobacteria bacterium]
MAAVAVLGCQRTTLQPGHAATIDVALRAAKTPDPLGGASGVSSLQATLYSDTPAQPSATATMPYGSGEQSTAPAAPFQNLAAASAAHLTFWGLNGSGSPVSVGRSAEFALPADGTVDVPIFFGVANAFSQGPTDPATLRAGGAAIPLGDGRVLLVGGRTGDTLLAPALYDHRTGLVTAISGSGPQALFPAAGALDGGRVLVAGGDDATGTPQGAIWLFDGSAFSQLSSSLAAPVSRAAALWFPTQQLVVIAGGLLAGTAGSR